VAVAQAAFAQARFSPGQQGGKPVRSLMRVEVSFEEQSTALPQKR
jgi:hypothetical protein